MASWRLMPETLNKFMTIISLCVVVELLFQQRTKK